MSTWPSSLAACLVSFLCTSSMVSLAEADTMATTPISSARSRALQISSILIDDQREEVFVFPHRLKDEAEIEAFDLSSWSTLASLGGERWRFAWGSRNVSRTGQHHSLLFARTGRSRAVGLSLGGSTTNRHSGYVTNKREEEAWAWHGALGARLSSARTALDLTLGLYATQSRKDDLTTMDGVDEFVFGVKETSTPRAFAQIRVSRKYSDSRILVAGGFVDEREVWQQRDTRLNPDRDLEVEAYGHDWFAAVLFEKETSRRSVARLGLRYGIGRSPAVTQVPPEGELRPRLTENHLGSMSASVERRVVRDLTARVSIGRSYHFGEMQDDQNYGASWSSSDSFAWGLEYARRWIRIAGLLRYDLGLDSPFASLDVSVRP